MPYFIRISSIHGMGLHTSDAIKPFQRLFAAFEPGRVETLYGRYINHHPEPNAYLIEQYGALNVFSKRAIEAGEEITCDYREIIAAFPDLENQIKFWE